MSHHNSVRLSQFLVEGSLHWQALIAPSLSPQLNRDYANHYLDSAQTDVRRGRMTWLNVIARQRLGSTDRLQLDQHYGRDDEDSVAKVNRCYDELKMRKSIMKQIEQTR